MSARIRQAVQRMQAYVPGEQPRDPDVVKLNTNENPYPPSPAALEALRQIGPDALRRYPDPVCSALRAKIAALHGVQPGHVLVGNGSDEVLALSARAFVERGGSLGYFTPSYSLYPVLADIEESVRKPVPLDEHYGWTLPDGYRADLFFLTHPNAPTGRGYTVAEVETLARTFDGVVLVDEAYADFAREHCADLPKRHANVLVARTLSKSYSLAGIRLGYALGPEPLIAALYKIKDSYNVNRLTQEIALAALNDQATMRANVAKIIATRERTADALRARGFAVTPSDANFIWAAPAHDRAQHLFEALRARGIYVRYFPGPRTGAHLRITIGTEAQMDRLIAALDAIAGGG